MFNSIVQGWINYYGRFYRSRLLSFLRHLNKLLVGWACRKYKRLKRRERRAMAWLAEISRRSPRLFAHWRLGARPDGWAMGAG
jgi:RNA-directed DNA polymerase